MDEAGWWWVHGLVIPQIQYQNMDKGYEEILRQSKGL